MGAGILFVQMVYSVFYHAIDQFYRVVIVG